MGKNKLKRFAENQRFEHVVEPKREELQSDFDLKGHWNEKVFKNPNPITLELGCGKGEYTVGLAQQYPERNFIGIDIKGARIWRGAKTVEENEIGNAAFLRCQIEMLPQAFAPNEVSEIWITFPDPQIKFRRQKHRLTHPHFLRIYQSVLGKEGLVHLKTDSEFLHGYTQGILYAYEQEILEAYFDIDFQVQHENSPLKTIQTHYEKLFRKEGKAITYLKFKLPNAF